LTDHPQLRFTVVIESSSVFPEQSWEAQVWHNINNPEWTALPLKKCDSPLAPLLTGSDEDYKFRRYAFSEEISLPSTGGHAQFTVRFRTSPQTEWQWINEQRHVSDGELIFPARASPFELGAEQETPIAPAKEELGKYIEGLSYDVEAEWRKSEAPGSILWDISGSVDGAKEGQSALKTAALGTPSSVARYFSLVRVWTPWLGPRHGRNKFKLTEDAVLCSFLRTDGSHLVLLGVSGTNDVLTVFESGENGEVVIKAANDNEESSKFKVLVAAADNFEVAICAIIYEARKLVTLQGEEEATEERKPSNPGDDVVLVEKDPKVQWMSEWYDGLSYCTWNSLGRDLSEEKIVKALDTLSSNGIRIVNLVIDDNWQTLDNDGEPQFKRRWKQFEGNPKGFPQGLRQTVDTIRKSQPNIEHIAVWHALFGYWGGISPEGDLVERFKTKEVKIKDPSAAGPIAHAFENRSMLAIDPEDIKGFYDEFYSYLVSVGIDSAKTDAQFFLDLLEDPEDRRKFITAYQDAWSIAALKHFGTRSISCMSMIPQVMFHSNLPTNKPSIPLRNSDDFFPDVAASHPWHVFCNAHNALLTRYLNAVPDWDMFQTSHPYSSFHAAARCVSGGPIYITDEPGKHDMSIINQMTAPTTQGKTVILRPSVIGRTIDIYDNYSEGHVLRVGSYTGWAKTGSGIIGLFNMLAAEASCMVPLMDFPGIHEDSDGQYIVRAHTSGKVTDLLHPSSPESLASVVLGQKGWEILTAYPTRSFTLKGSRGCNAANNNLTHVAVLGLLGKMTGAAALASSDIFVVENGRLRFDISLKALGVLGIYFSNLQDRSIARNFMVTIYGRTVPRKTVWREGGEDAKVLAVDVSSAWKAMGLESGWSNEVVVQVFVG
jgi:hypothetical protein